MYNFLSITVLRRYLINMCYRFYRDKNNNEDGDDGKRRNYQ